MPNGGSVGRICTALQCYWYHRGVVNNLRVESFHIFLTDTGDVALSSSIRLRFRLRLRLRFRFVFAESGNERSFTMFIEGL